jgi:predicted ATP-grasp superfamily ATP-dependent carboligase
MQKFIVFGGSLVVVASVLRAIRSFSDAKVIVLGDHQTRPLRWSGLCERYLDIHLDGRDDAMAQSLLKDLVNESPDILLIPCDCDAVRMTNRLSLGHALKTIPIPDTATLDMFDDKWRFYEFCMQHALPVPTTLYIGDKQALDFETVVRALGAPFLIKPSNQAGSMGIQLIGDARDYDQLVRHNRKYVFSRLIAQRYIDGVDIDVSLYAINGRVSSLAVQQSEGDIITFLTNPELASIAQRICQAATYHGVMHVDARIDRHSGKLYLIESNPRFWASLTAAIWCGLNFVAEVVAPDVHTAQPRQLSKGTASVRSPYIQPSMWLPLLFDQSCRGRLLRAMTFDLQALHYFSRSFPTMLIRFLGARARLLLRQRKV